MRKSLALITTVVLMTALAGLAADKVPPLVNYQGKLLNNSGSIVPNGNYQLEFRVWSAASGGSLSWGRTYPVNVTDGLFNVVLGDGGGVISGAQTTNLVAAFDGSDRFLGLTITKDQTGATVANAQEIQPRQQLLSTPYAIQANDAAKLGGTSATNYLKNGDVVISGSVRSTNLQVDDQAYFVMKDSGAGLNPVIAFDANDFMLYKRTENYLCIYNGSNEKLRITSSNVVVSASGGITGPGTVPLGSIMMWSGSAVPSGWALCDGNNNTPDLRGRFVLGSGTGASLTARTVGQKGGEETHVLTPTEMPAHAHGVTDPKHSHQINNDETRDGWNIGSYYASDRGQSVSSSLSSATGISIQNTGGNGAHNTIPPFYVLAFIMRVQ
jgi:microcystin-dependent protein